MSSASSADRRIQKSSSEAQRSSVAQSFGKRSTRGPTTLAARLSTRAHVRDSRSRRSSSTTSPAPSNVPRRSSSSTAAARHSCTGSAHSASTVATSSSWPSVGTPPSAALTTLRVAGTVVPQCSRSLLRYRFSWTARTGSPAARSPRSISVASWGRRSAIAPASLASAHISGPSNLRRRGVPRP